MAKNTCLLAAIFLFLIPFASSLSTPSDIVLPITILPTYLFSSLREGLPTVVFSLGTPAQNISLVVDTGSGLVWAHCPCDDWCHLQKIIHSTSSTFRPWNSSTYSKVSCGDRMCKFDNEYVKKCSSSGRCAYDYEYSYSFIAGPLARDNLLLGGAIRVPEFSFGCTMKCSQDRTAMLQGLAGFNRNPLSMPSQLKIRSFTTCLPTFGSGKVGTLVLGTSSGSSNARTQGLGKALVPLDSDPTYYFVKLVSVVVGSRVILINDNVINKIMIDTGGKNLLVFEMLQEVGKTFSDAIGLTPINGSTTYPFCYRLPPGLEPNQVEVPYIGLNLDGVILDLPRQNVVDYFEQENLLCLNFQSDLGINSLGAAGQQNIRIHYNLKANAISFEPTIC